MIDYVIGEEESKKKMEKLVVEERGFRSPTHSDMDKGGKKERRKGWE